MLPLEASCGLRRPLSALSPSIAHKRKFLAVVLTVGLSYHQYKSLFFRNLEVPETIEW